MFRVMLSFLVLMKSQSLVLHMFIITGRRFRCIPNVLLALSVLTLQCFLLFCDVGLVDFSFFMLVIYPVTEGEAIFDAMVRCIMIWAISWHVYIRMESFSCWPKLNLVVGIQHMEN